jgi:hypothetical protein
MMTFIRGNAFVEDDANRGLYKVAEFGVQPEHLLSKIDADATRKGLNIYKATVSLRGYEFTCARCGDHFIVVNGMTASEPIELTNQDLIAQQNRLRPFARHQAPSRECEVPLS